MPTPVPDSLRATLGEEGADALVRWLDAYLQEHAVRRDEYREVLSRLDVLEERVVQLEKRMDERFEQFEARMVDRFEQVDDRFEQVDKRFEQVDQRFGEVGGRLNTIDQRLDDLQVQIRRQIRWSVGTIALFGTIVTVLLAIAEFTA